MPRHVRGMFLSELWQRRERHDPPELLPVRAVTPLHLPILGRLPRIDQVVRDAKLLTRRIEDVELGVQRIGALLVAGVVVRENRTVVRLDALDREGGCSHELSQEHQRSPVTLLRRHPAVSPPGTGIDRGELIEPSALVFPHVGDIDLHDLARYRHLRLPAIFRDDPATGRHQLLAHEHLVDTPPVHHGAVALLESQCDLPGTEPWCGAPQFPDQRDRVLRRFPGVAPVGPGAFPKAGEALGEVATFPAMEGIAREAGTAGEFGDGHAIVQMKAEPAFSLRGDQELGVMGHHSHDAGVSDMIVHHTPRP